MHCHRNRIPPVRIANKYRLIAVPVFYCICNFEKDRLVDLILNNRIVPAVNQMETHPFWQQKELREVMDKYQIRMMAWAPFAEGQNHLFTDPTLYEIGAAHHKTPAQVVLRWFRQENIIAIPKSIHEERIRQNYEVNDFSLTETELQRIRQMDTGNPLILQIRSMDEVYRLYNIRFEQ